MSSNPRILLLGDYSNCQRTLGIGLQRLGCNVTVISDGSSWQHCHRDIDISRPPGKLGGIKLFARCITALRNDLRGYDIVSIHDPNFLRLRPKLLKPIFRQLKRHNGTVTLNAMSYDTPFLQMLAAPNCPLRYSEWFIEGKPNRLMLTAPQLWQQWNTETLRNYHDYIYNGIDGAMSVLYEYHLALQRVLPPDKIAYGGIPIDTDAFVFEPLPHEIKKVKLFLGRDRSRMLEKGSDFLETAARRVVERHPHRAELTIAENRPFNEFTQLLSESHIVLDQIYSYTPATTALMAMAMGKVVVSGGEADYYNFIGENSNRPIANAPLSVEELTQLIESLVLNPQNLAATSIKSREFVERHNNCRRVAERYLNFWNTIR